MTGPAVVDMLLMEAPLAHHTQGRSVKKNKNKPGFVVYL